MAIIDKNNNVSYTGAVIGERSHMWMDGMEDVFAIVYDSELNEIKEIKTGYYGSDGHNLMETEMKVDLNMENARAIIKLLKKWALQEFSASVKVEKQAIKKGRKVEVIRGRKVKKGTILEVFWIGEKETYKSRQYSWMNETETIAGCRDEKGNTIWIKAEYLKNITEIKSPSARDRKLFIKSYIKNYFPKHYGIYGIMQIAKGQL